MKGLVFFLAALGDVLCFIHAEDRKAASFTPILQAKHCKQSRIEGLTFYS